MSCQHMGNIVFKAIKLGTHITGVSAGIQSSEAKAAPVSRGGGNKTAVASCQIPVHYRLITSVLL